MKTLIAAEPSLSPLFADHMVLQREMQTRVWGQAEPGTAVTVAFSGHEASCTTGAESRWEVTLPSFPASGQPQEMQVRIGNKNLVVKDILIGEVWLCSGQSNMDGSLAWFSLQNGKGTPLVEEMKNADFPRIRQFEVARRVSPSERQTDCGRADYQFTSLAGY